MRLRFLTFSFIIVFSQVSFAKESLQLGSYKASNCETHIFLEKENNLLRYKIISIDGNITGNAHISGNSIIFSKLRNYLDGDKTDDVIGEIISKNRFLVQNYGNSLNMYSMIPSCEDKYLEYNRLTSFLTVIRHKSILYIRPNQETKMYVVEGDKVNILDEQTDTNGQKWYFINYKGKKDINMWIKAESIDTNGK